MLSGVVRPEAEGLEWRAGFGLESKGGRGMLAIAEGCWEMLLATACDTRGGGSLGPRGCWRL